MHNAFLLYMPPGNMEAMVHYEDTIKKKVPWEAIAEHVPRKLGAELRLIFGESRIAVWGSQAGPLNRARFARMSAGDDVLIIEGDKIKLIGKIAAKVESADLSRKLWQPVGSGSHTPWQLIYFIANPRELNVAFAKFCRLFGYEADYRLRGFTSVSANRLENFYAKYEDLYSVLVKVQRGERPIAMASEDIVPSAAVPEAFEAEAEIVNEVLTKKRMSDHLTIQCKLARLGIRAGERVWVPVGDQSKLRNECHFDSFDKLFTAGIDVPHSYVENIDVVWKQEFRIGAAYEIENSTSVYSGLLRFADLNVLAPNSIYPMFIVAPRERKNIADLQVDRPTFQRLEMHKKVRFLSYETIDELDADSTNRRVDVDAIYQKSEPLGNAA